jgi:hypothetical protein
MSRARFRVCLRGLSILLLGLCAWPLPAVTADAEPTLRAAFLHRLVDFVAWPDDRFAGREPVIRFCVGRAVPLPLRRELERAAARRQAPQRTLQIIALDEAAACELAYLGEADAATRVPDPGTLIVADSAATLRRLGHLALVLQVGSGDRARLIFHGNRQRIAEAQCTLSAKFLALVRFDG